MGFRLYDPDPTIDALAESLALGIAANTSTDSLVFDTFPKMEVRIPGYVNSFGEELGNHYSLSWDAWWEQVCHLAQLLKDPFTNGRFVPTAILGISNGGLMVADLLTREIFKGTPILSLWANRVGVDLSNVDKSFIFFDNSFNAATMSVIEKWSHDSGREATILLVDDLIQTSTTIIQAITYIKKKLRDHVKLLVTPLYCLDKTYLDSIKEFLPPGYGRGRIFHISMSEYTRLLTADRSFFPYGKVLKR